MLIYIFDKEKAPAIARVPPASILSNNKTKEPITMIKPPCLNCSNRIMGCHSKCELYIGYRARIDSLNNKKAEAKKQTRMVDDCLSDISKMKMYKGW
jgi:hypothetical protein